MVLDWAMGLAVEVVTRPSSQYWLHLPGIFFDFPRKHITRYN